MKGRYLYQRISVGVLLAICMLLLMALKTDLGHSPPVSKKEELMQLEAAIEPTSALAAAKHVVSQHPSYPNDQFSKTVMLKGLVFNNSTKIASPFSGEFAVKITTSVVKSLSENVKEHVKQIFNDEYGECKFYATLPAMVKRDGKIDVIQRVWLAQYEKMKSHYRRSGKKMEKMVYEWKNTWQENYLYSMQLDDDYNLVRPGNIMGLPTTTNAAFTYKSDGPMDPRLFSIGDDTYLSFHTWLVDPTYNHQITGRLHLYDMDRHIKKKLTLNTKLHRTEINWIPLDVNGDLYYTYSLDPLRVMKCDTKTASCRFIFEQEATNQNPFVYSSDHLRGGTPWVMYKYPYYISLGHNVLVTTAPHHDYSVYNSNILVLCVKPWRMVYTSRNVLYNNTWITSQPIIRNQTILTSFFYPSGIIKRSDDVLDVSGHLNDAAGYILRFRGIKELMNEIISRDKLNIASTAPKVRTVQQYVMEAGKAWFPTWKFKGDIIKGTVEKPATINTA